MGGVSHAGRLPRRRPRRAVPPLFQRCVHLRIPPRCCAGAGTCCARTVAKTQRAALTTQAHRNHTSLLLKSALGGSLSVEPLRQALDKKGDHWRQVTERKLPELAGLPRYVVYIDSAPAARVQDAR